MGCNESPIRCNPFRLKALGEDAKIDASALAISVVAGGAASGIRE
jgi:hypothetical protein